MYNPVFQPFYAHYLIQPLHQLNPVGSVFIPILEMGNLRHREDKLLAKITQQVIELELKLGSLAQYPHP